MSWFYVALAVAVFLACGFSYFTLLVGATKAWRWLSSAALVAATCWLLRIETERRLWHEETNAQLDAAMFSIKASAREMDRILHESDEAALSWLGQGAAVPRNSSTVMCGDGIASWWTNISYVVFQREPARLVRVVDGDTVRLLLDVSRPGEEIIGRLARVDAPEMNTPEGPKAKAALEKFFKGKPVRLSIERKGRDRYRRVVVEIWVAAKIRWVKRSNDEPLEMEVIEWQNVSDWLLNEKLAQPWPHEKDKQ